MGGGVLARCGTLSSVRMSRVAIEVVVHTTTTTRGACAIARPQSVEREHRQASLQRRRAMATAAGGYVDVGGDAWAM
jgi:hypothetical protein